MTLDEMADSRPRCPRCRSQELELQLNMQWMFAVERVEDGVMVLAKGDDISVYWNPWLRCGECGHVWHTSRRYELPPHTIEGW